MKRAAFVVSACVFVAACSSPDDKARVNADVGLYDQEAFPVLSAAVVYRCGSLDCHGSIYRNMRVFGYGGLRKTVAGVPDNADQVYEEELKANYQSLVGVEPEKFAEVIAEGGREPERLALVAKPRSLQNHKGGPVTKAGDDMDNCLTAWLRKDVAATKDACTKANQFFRK